MLEVTHSGQVYKSILSAGKKHSDELHQASLGNMLPLAMV